MFFSLDFFCLPRMPQSVNLAVSVPRAQWIMAKVLVWKNMNVHVSTMGIFIRVEHKFQISAIPGMTLFYKIYNTAWISTITFACKHLLNWNIQNTVLYLTISNTPSICKSGKWKCTKKKCPGTCVIYGSGHYSTFDQRTYAFQGHCGYVAIKVNKPCLHHLNGCVWNDNLTIHSLVFI